MNTSVLVFPSCILQETAFIHHLFVEITLCSLNFVSFSKEKKEKE